jgi:hypothetical protein
LSVSTKAIQREESGSRIELEVLDPETPRSSKLREILRRLTLPIVETLPSTRVPG